LRRLYGELYDPVMGYLAARLRPREAAEDLCSQIFLRWLQRLDQFDAKRGSVYSWTMQMTRNALIDHLRAQRETVSVDDVADRLVARDPGPLDRLLNEEERLLLDGVLAGQSAAIREMFSLRFADGMQYAEIGQLLGLSENTVKQRFSRQLRQLRAQLEPRREEGGAPHAGWNADPRQSA
jgi:RNA polymerase sigma-70 factor (ECF subfamily)